MFKAFARVAARSIAIQLEEAAAAARSKQPYVDPTPKIHQYNAASKGKIAGSNVKPLEKSIVTAPAPESNAKEKENAAVVPIEAAPSVTPEVLDDLTSGAGVDAAAPSSSSWSSPSSRKKKEALPVDMLVSQESSRPNNEPMPKPEPVSSTIPTPESTPDVVGATQLVDQPAEPTNLTDNVDPEDVS